MPRPTASLFAVAARRHHADAADGDLLGRWATAGDADAFAELVRRYGPLVWRTCRAGAGEASAEDAFQATFLALARRAGALRQPGAVVGWLHRTAGRAAAEARRRDRRLLPPPPALPAPDPLDRLTARELLAAVDAELARLPDRYRLPLLLCGVDGLSQEEAAARLGWSAGSVKGRLERGRAMLRSRLAARGLAVPAVLGLAVVPDRLATAAMAVACGAVPAGVAELVPGGVAVNAWLWAKTAGVVLTVGLAAIAGGPRPPADPPKPAAKGPAGDAPLVLWEGTTDGAGSGVWHPDGKHVVAVGAFDADPRKPHEVRAWDAATGKLAKSFPVPPPYLALLQWGGTVAVSPDGRTVAAGLWRGPADAANVVAVWDWDRPAGRPALLPLRDTCSAVCFGPDLRLLYSLTQEGRLSAYRVGTDTKAYAEAAVPKGRHGGGLVAMSVVHHPTARVLAVGHNEMRTSFWNAGNLDPLDSVAPPGPLQGHPVAFSPDGRHMASQGQYGGEAPRLVVGRWDVDDSIDQRLTARLIGRFGLSLPRPAADAKPWNVSHLAYHPGGRFLALAGGDKTVRLVDTSVGTPTAELTGFTGPVRSAHFAADGRRLLTVDSGSVRVWDVAARLAAPAVRDMRLTHEKELDRFAGEWLLVSSRIDGVDTREFGGQLGVRVVAVDPAVTPKAVNGVNTVGPDHGQAAHGIYEFLDADTYRVCYSRDEARRPTAFAAEKGDGQSLFVLRRAKPAAK